MKVYVLTWYECSDSYPVSVHETVSGAIRSAGKPFFMLEKDCWRELLSFSVGMGKVGQVLYASPVCGNYSIDAFEVQR
jgi:hypothetical protein